MAARGASVVGPAVQVGLHAHPRRQRAHRRRSARGRASGRRAARGSRAGARATPAPARRPTDRRRRRPSRRPVARRRRRARSRTAATSSTPDQRPAAEGRRVEASALLVGEGDDGHRGVLGHREGGAHAQRAVVAPAGAHAVQVRADAPPRRRARRAPPSRLPAGSISTRSPTASARRANHAPAASSSGVQASRVVPRSSRPIGLEVGQAPGQILGRDHDEILHAASGRT